MGEVVLHGDCLVNRVDELHKLFLHLLSGSDEIIEVDMSATGKCDTAFFQLICAACRSFSNGGKKIVLKNEPPYAVVKQFTEAGFIAACKTCEQATCLFQEIFFRDTESDSS